MHTGFFDVFHNAADHDVLSITDRINVDFHRIIQKTVEQDG